MQLILLVTTDNFDNISDSAPWQSYYKSAVWDGSVWDGGFIKTKKNYYYVDFIICYKKN